MAFWRSKVQGTAQTELLSGIWFAPLRLMPSEISLGEASSRSNFTADVNTLKVGLLTNGYEELAVGATHVLRLPKLPNIHVDPFDRILVAQPMAESYALPCSSAELGSRCSA